MNTTNASAHPETRKAYEQLLALRDELKLKMHLAAMDIREEWNRLEPRVADAERLTKEATDASAAVVAGALSDLALDLQRLAKKIAPRPGP